LIDASGAAANLPDGSVTFDAQIIAGSGSRSTASRLFAGITALATMAAIY